MEVRATSLDGLWEIVTQPRGDARGSLTRVFCTEQLAVIRPALRFVQTNLTFTAERGTVRGLHFQRAPALEAKLIRCLRGRVYDVAVDLRAGSPTFGRWHAVELSGENQCEIFIPEGFAHGFQTLTDDVEMLYQHTAAHAPVSEGGLRHDDDRLAIPWPLPVTQISARDREHPPLDAAFQPLQLNQGAR